MESPDTLQNDSAWDCKCLPLARTRTAATVVYLFFIALTVLSVPLFVYQLRYEVEPGSHFVEEPGGAIHVWSHALRAALGLLLARSLRRYLIALRAIRDKEQDADARVLASIATWWRTLAASLTLATAYGAFAIYVNIPEPPVFTDIETFSAAEEPVVAVEFRLAEFSPSGNPDRQRQTPTGETIWLHETPVITNDGIREATVIIGPDGEPAINVFFTSVGEAAIREATRQHLDRPMAILVDGKIVSAPIVGWEIGESAMIRTSGSLEEVQQIARSLVGRK